MRALTIPVAKEANQSLFLIFFSFACERREFWVEVRKRFAYEGVTMESPLFKGPKLGESERGGIERPKHSEKKYGELG